MEPLHPETTSPLTDLERLLWRFRMAAHEAQVMTRGFRQYEDVTESINDDLMFSLTNQALIIVSKFLEVWDDSSQLAKTDTRIVPMRRAVQPLIDRIHVWKGLHTYRNTTLAHAYVTKKGMLLSPWELIQQEQVPTFHAEIILLLEIPMLAALAVLSVFEQEFLPIQALCGPPAKTASPGPGIQLGTQINSALRPIAMQVESRLLKECGISTSTALAEVFERAVDPEVSP